MRIQYICVCHRGLVRRNNQDNLVWERHCLPVKNDGLNPHAAAEKDLGKPLLFGVFDGMGGEPRGDVASYIAAETAAQWPVSDAGTGLIELCLTINRKISDYADRNKLQSCGTTAAMILVSEHKVTGCNLGDSKIFLYREDRLTQMSEDHVLPSFSGSKPPLLQFLGIPETEMIIEPAVFEENLLSEDVYLICSDGLTDMLSERQILGALATSECLSDKASSLLNGALAAGGKDNTSFILIRTML